MWVFKMCTKKLISSVVFHTSAVWSLRGRLRCCHDTNVTLACGFLSPGVKKKSQ